MAELTSIRTILIPVDGSACSDEALKHASSLAKATGAKLEILRVSTVPPGYEHGVPVYSEAAAQLALDREELRSIPVVEGLTFEKHHRLGDPGDEIVSFAKSHPVDLIIMGTHGRTGWGRLVYGSVAEKVIRHAECPVLTYRMRQAAQQESKS